MVDDSQRLNISEILKDTYKYSRATGLIYTKHNNTIVTCMRKGFSVIRVAKRDIFSQHVAWLLYYGEWPSNFVCRLDNNEHNDRIDNLVHISSDVLSRYPVYRKGLIKPRKSINRKPEGIEVYFSLNSNGVEHQLYLGKYHTMQDAYYRVYAYNVERKQQNRSILANIERNARACV